MKPTQKSSIIYLRVTNLKMFCYQLSRKENDTTTAESLIDPYYLPQEIKNNHI